MVKARKFAYGASGALGTNVWKAEEKFQSKILHYVIRRSVLKNNVNKNKLKLHRIVRLVKGKTNKLTNEKSAEWLKTDDNKLY